MTDTSNKLFCRKCRRDVELRSGGDGIQAVCNCVDVPLMVRHGRIPERWNNYTPMEKEE